MDSTTSKTDTTLLRVIDIIDGTIVDGPGLRTSIYLAGCIHQCPGCHNPQSWDPTAGEDMSIDQIIAHIVENDMNVSLSGGDPLYQIDGTLALCRAIKDLGKTIWLYTGYTYHQIRQSHRLAPILDVIDVLVDGPFVEEKRDISLRFRGSSNQRLIDMHKTEGDDIRLWD